MLVYRLQDEIGQGPYWAGAADGFDLWNTETHPSPQQDIGFHKDGYIYGFANLRQYREWFHEEKWNKHFQERGFTVCVYDVPNRHVFEGWSQVSFLCCTGKIIDRLLPMEAFNSDND